MAMSEFQWRTIFSLIAVPFALYIVYLGGPVLVTLIGSMAGIAAWEFYRMSRAGGVEPLQTPGVAVTALIPVAVHADTLGVIFVSLRWLPVVAIILLGMAIWLRGPTRRPGLAVAATLFGIMYAGLFTYAYSIRYHRYAIGAVAGSVLLALPLVITWLTDVGAYLIGRSFGKKKLMPSVSPGKTIAGSVAGLSFAIIGAWFYVEFLLEPYAHLSMRPYAVLAFGLLISVAAQTGDLAESLLKREAGVKNSSGLIPGHGGMLDRIDSLLFALPAAYLLLDLWLIPAPA
ncbi:MAG TPA: phosphatidate cytidylyltransferase [Gemmatimonadaceae bacterium]|nr:phosphatidate cytidylyltransferase [Gemmatimonadaceae bacterium]